MAVRTTINIQKLNEPAGVDLAFVAVDAVNGMQVNNTGKCIVFVQAEGTASCTVTIASLPDLNDRTGDASHAVTGDAVRAFGPFGDSSIWGDGTRLFLDFSAVLGTVKVAVAQS